MTVSANEVPVQFELESDHPVAKKADFADRQRQDPDAKHSSQLSLSFVRRANAICEVNPVSGHYRSRFRIDWRHRTEVLTKPLSRAAGC